MADYCAYTDVASEVQHLTLTASSDPSTTEVTTWCGQATALMDSRFQAAGITTPITDTEKLKVVKAIAVDWVVWKVLASIDFESEEAGRRKTSHDNAMKAIVATPSILEQTSTTYVGPEGSLSRGHPIKRGARNW